MINLPEIPTSDIYSDQWPCTENLKSNLFFFVPVYDGFEMSLKDSSSERREGIFDGRWGLTGLSCAALYLGSFGHPSTVHDCTQAGCRRHKAAWFRPTLMSNLTDFTYHRPPSSIARKFWTWHLKNPISVRRRTLQSTPPVELLYTLLQMAKYWGPFRYCE